MGLAIGLLLFFVMVVMIVCGSVNKNWPLH